MDYKLHADHGSLYNTPPCFRCTPAAVGAGRGASSAAHSAGAAPSSIYVTGLVFEWIAQQGGVEEMARRAAAKSSAIYAVISASLGFYRCTVQLAVRSRMNIPFRIAGGQAALEQAFLAGAQARGMIQLKGHRCVSCARRPAPASRRSTAAWPTRGPRGFRSSVGGIRASLYNAVTLEEAQALATFMRDFQAEHAPPTDA